MNTTVQLDELRSEFLPVPVPYAVVTPEGDGPFPLCIVLHGGGGSRQSLLDCVPIYEHWWAEGTVPRVVLASPTAGMSYYLEDSADSVSWDKFIAGPLLDHLRATAKIKVDRKSTAITGMSMGGFGALKIAFAHPNRFIAVAAMSPVVEPGLDDRDIGARNKLHHTSGGPERLIGPGRNNILFMANNPANRVLANAEEIRREDLAIYIEVGDDDFINVHDGAEFLHRILWNLDISHEYRLTRGADHVGPSMLGRMRDAFAWLGSVLVATSESEKPEEIAEGEGVSPTSRVFIKMVREQLRPARELAAATDETTHRRYGKLPDIRLPSNEC